MRLPQLLADEKKRMESIALYSRSTAMNINSMHTFSSLRTLPSGSSFA